MFLRFEENPNFGFADDRVLQERSEARPIRQVLRRRQGAEVWCDVIGVHKGNKLVPAMARKVEDSGEGICYLVYGGLWGIRLKDPACQDDWSFEDAHQWGEPFLLLPADGMDIEFAKEKR